MELNKKIDFAIKLLQSIPQDGPIELSYSGGKDSDVILELAKMSGIPFEAIYKNTTIDPPGTLAHCRENGVTILQPKMSFLKIVEQKGTPSRFARFCCEILKEYKLNEDWVALDARWLIRTVYEILSNTRNCFGKLSRQNKNSMIPTPTSEKVLTGMFIIHSIFYFFATIWMITVRRLPVVCFRKLQLIQRFF